jgi:alpha-aminoadipic semialdehyde synthase
MRIGIRREDKNEWEARVPITPADAARLVEEGIEVVLQPSSIRIFPDDMYKEAGAAISEDLSSCPIIFAVKEIPVGFIEAGKTYVFFSHTIKGQSYNMPLLKRMMELRCQLIDYELVTDSEGRRLIFFGRHAGLAGMIDTFWALGKKLAWEGMQTPFSAVKMAYEYSSLEEAKAEITKVGEQFDAEGVPAGLFPLIFGFAGYGNVSLGAQEIFDLFPHDEIAPADLAAVRAEPGGTVKRLTKVVFKEADMVEPVDQGIEFELQDYYTHPVKYRSQFDRYLPHLTGLVNCIYWDERYPRLVTYDYLKRSYAASETPRLKVIGDISCDIEGSIQCTVKVTDPGNPVYVYDPTTGTTTDGWKGKGPVIMAVDNLPCELPKEASDFFSEVLTPFIPRLVQADFSVPFDDLEIPAELHRAVILHEGELTPNYKHLNQYL